MKKLILLAFTALIMVGCDQQDVANGFKKDDFGICVYDSCEYLIAVHGYAGFLSHKGNCRFCEKRDSIKWEKRKKELEELIIKLKK